jgi:HK97 gp10 family phage protein
MRFVVQLKGQSDLDRKMDRLAASVQGKALAGAALAGAQVVEARAKELAPVRTGNLRRSIHSELASVSTESALAKVGTNVEYAPYVEYGTRRMSPRPYLRPAFDTAKAEAEETIRKSFERLLRQAR